MLSRELIDKYAWVDEIEAWSVAVVAGTTPEDVLRVYGADPEAPVGDYTFSQMADLQGAYDDLKFHVQAFEHDDRVVAWENNGWSGSHAEIARRCSTDDGSFFSVYWNVNAFGLLTQAVGSELTARFESLYPFDPDPPQPGDIRPTWAVGDDVDPGLAWRVCLALMEQQTGVAVDPGWLARPRATFRIPEPHTLYGDAGVAQRE